MSSRKISPVTIDGKTIWVEVEDIQIDALRATEARKRPTDLRETAEPTGALDVLKQKVISVGDTLEAIVGSIGKGVDKVNPDEWSVEVTIGFAGEKQIPFLAKGSVDGGIKVNAKWKKEG